MTDIATWPDKSSDGTMSYQAIFEKLPFPSVVLDRGMVVRAVNQHFLERYGLGQDQVLGRYCYQVFYDRTKPCPSRRCCFFDALSGVSGCSNMHQYVSASGEEIFEEVHLVGIGGQDGEAEWVLEIVRDITEAKRLQAGLQEANEFLNRLVDSLVGVVVAADLKGRIMFVNRSVERVLGYTPEELKGQNLHRLAPLSELRKMRRAMNDGGGRTLMMRTHMLAKNGEKVPGRVNTSLVFVAGRAIATVGIFTDLREQLKMQDSLAQARLQVVQSEKLAGLGRMAAGVAHELNNPLTGITVYADLIKESLPPDDPHQADLDCIKEDAERCRDIVLGLLDYSRQGEVLVSEADLNEIINEAFALIRDNAVFLQVQVRREQWPEPLNVECDPKLLRQVFINLFMNAVDAMDGHGVLTVSTGLDDEGWRWARVSDNGSGIPPEHIRRIFDPFFTTKEVGRGTGLGLSVVFGVMQRHGGEISLERTGPEGTTFMLRLPEHAPDELKSMANHPPEPDVLDEEELIS